MESINLRFRVKGQIKVVGFAGEVVLEGEGVVGFADLPLKNGVLDLTHVPVVCIGGKKGRSQDRRLEDFHKEAPDFNGVVFLQPYSWSWGWSDGVLQIPSRAVLEGKFVSGGRVETKLVNHRWLRDGRLVADKAQVLHGKVVKTFEEGVEQTPFAEMIAEAAVARRLDSDLPLQKLVHEVWWELYRLEEKRRLGWGLKANSAEVNAAVKGALLRKLQAAKARRIADLPADFSLTVEEVDPELWVERETVGTIEVPGLGRVPLKGHADNGRIMPYVAVRAKDIASITGWSYTVVGLVIAEIAANPPFWGLFHWSDPCFSEGEDRFPRIRERLAADWQKFQRDKNYPRDVEVAAPKDADPPVTPAPVTWGFDLLTGETWTAYAVLRHVITEAKGRIYDKGWRIAWCDDAAEAAENDKKGRASAASHVFARNLEAEMAAAVQEVNLPAEPPADYVPPTRAFVQAEEEKAQAAHLALVRRFVEEVRANPVYARLPRGVQERFEKPLKNSWGYDREWVITELKAEWAKAAVFARKEATGELLVNFGGHFRVMGATGNCQYWVVGSDGTGRDPDVVEYRKRYTSEGSKYWRLVAPEELALTWSKDCSAGAHCFEVVKLPASGCTSEQLAAVAVIEAEIAGRWAGATGLASGEPSPSIGGGWNLTGREKAVFKAEPPKPAEALSTEGLATGLAALKARFGK